MQETITQAIRPYLAHYGNACDAAERFERFSADEEGASLAADCAAAHANLAARRARDALDAPAVEPILDPSWVGTVNMDAGFDPARREAVAHSLFRVLNQHGLAVMAAEGRKAERLTRTVRADAVARHYMLAMLR